MANKFSTKNDSGKANDFDRSVNDRLKQIRLALKLSQARFCAGIFLTNGHYAELELGNRRINDRTMKLICVIYGVNERYLKTGKGEMFNPEVDLRVERLNGIFKNLPDSFQDYILNLAENLKKLYDSCKGL